tara:strand:- start:239 stop:856 length:618 start_codon:yes stop_codon:yes gene_type:complete
MKLKIEKSGKKQSSTMSVSDSVFAADFNEPLIHQVLVSYMAGSRSGTKSQKSRSEVRGGGRKPWRQKGTGRARAGTIRSPLWRGGGVTFAAKPRDYSKKVNRKMFRGAMRSILSELIRQKRFICVDEFEVTESKTKLVKDKLNKLGLKEALIITEGLSENLYLGVRNIPKVDVMDSNEINPYSLVGFEKILITQAAVEKVEEWLS